MLGGSGGGGWGGGGVDGSAGPQPPPGGMVLPGGSGGGGFGGLEAPSDTLPLELTAKLSVFCADAIRGPPGLTLIRQPLPLAVAVTA